jgi:tetratricopeptide (TPR) repeat protein
MLERQRLLMLIELDLFQAARDAARAFFERRDTRPTDWVALAEAMRQSGQLERAVLLLEEANLRFPNNPDIRSQLAASYLSQDRPTTAAEVLRPLAWANPEKALSTAELYLKGGAPERAISMNQRVPDQKDKFRQRLAILLDQEQYELAANLYPRLARLGLLEDEQILYALAYALYQTREFEKSEELLSQIQDPSLYRQGVQIRQAIEQCRAEPTRC